MNQEKPPEKDGGFIDSVFGTFEFLWNFLGSPPPKTEVKEPSLLDWIPDSIEAKPDGQIPAQVVDTEGESEDA